MVSADENRLLTESGPGTPGGDVLRRYWQPAALTEELDSDRPVVPVRLLGEDLVLFRDDQDRLGMIGRRCPHRGVDLSYGRVEDGGLRCPFHGWLFDVTGACLETPAEPPASTFHTRVCQVHYPVAERNGIVWAFLGDGDPPELPGLDCFVAPGPQVFAFKGMWGCNWLQAHEVGIDPAHAAFLHRFLGATDGTYGLQFRDTIADTDVTVAELMREAAAPDITIELTPFGFRSRTLRRYRDEFTHVRVSNCIFPNAITIAMSREMSIFQWHVPIDDRRCYWYSMFVSYGDPVDAEVMRAQRISQVTLPGYQPIADESNSWGFDPGRAARADLHRHGRRHQCSRSVGGRVARSHLRPHRRTPQPDRCRHPHPSPHVPGRTSPARHAHAHRCGRPRRGSVAPAPSTASPPATISTQRGAISRPNDARPQGGLPRWRTDH